MLAPIFDSFWPPSSVALELSVRYLMIPSSLVHLGGILSPKDTVEWIQDKGEDWVKRLLGPFQLTVYSVIIFWMYHIQCLLALWLFMNILFHKVDQISWRSQTVCLYIPLVPSVFLLGSCLTNINFLMFLLKGILLRFWRGFFFVCLFYILIKVLLT